QQVSILEQIRVKRCPGRRSGCRLGDSAQYVVLSSSTLALATEAPICAAAAILRASRKGEGRGPCQAGADGTSETYRQGIARGLAWSRQLGMAEGAFVALLTALCSALPSKSRASGHAGCSGCR